MSYGQLLHVDTASSRPVIQLLVAGYVKYTTYIDYTFIGKVIL